MTYKLQGIGSHGYGVKKKVTVCPMVLYDHSVDESEMEVWRKAYAVDESGVPVLYGDEQILTELVDRTATLQVYYADRSGFKHKRNSWRIFFTNYRIIATLPKDHVPSQARGVGSVRIGPSQDMN